VSGIDIVGALLYADQAVTTAVPQARIKAGTLPQSIALPAILLTSISATDLRMLASDTPRRVTERVQVTLAVSSYDQVDTLLRLIRRACAGKVGTIADIAGVSVLTDGVGPDFMDEQTSIFMRSQDFLVSFLEA
jgi:hypothetical protein